MIKEIDKNNVNLTNIEKKLIESEERFNYALLATNDGIWDWNLLTGHVYYSPRWKSMLGYDENELEETIDTWEKLVHPKDKDIVLKKVQNCIEGLTKEFSTVMHMVHKDGHDIIVLSRAFLVRDASNNKAIRLVGTHVDITQDRQTEIFMKNTNTILKMIATGTPASTVYDEIALMYQARHPGMRCSLLELKDGKLLHGGAPSMPKEYQNAVHGLAYGPNVGSCGASTYRGKRVLVENIETDPNWKDIKQYALPHGMRSCWSEPIINSEGKVLGAFGMYYDYPGLPNEKESDDLLSAARLSSIVMERDQSLQHLKENQLLIAEQSKLASMGEMIGNIAHQWRQPLSVIATGVTGMQLQKEYNLLTDELFNSTCATINNNAQYLSKTIDDFKNYIRNDRKKVSFNLAEDISSFLNIVEGNIKNDNINMVLNVQENIIITSYPNELIQCLINIFNNAIDALKERTIKDKLIFISTFIQKNSVVIKIKDNAGGIPDASLSKIFEPYYTTKHQSKGTGLGLHMTYNMVVDSLLGTIKACNVTYQYENHNYNGAEFVITLPLS